MTTLDQIALAGNSDKSSRFHAYTSVYEELLWPWRSAPVRLLEIGILGGDSLRMWANWFTHPESTIVGVDIHDRQFQSDDKRIQTIYGDAGSPEFLQSLQGPFTCVLDDGSHFCSHQRIAFEMLWDKVAPGGFYCVEDIHTVHSRQHSDMSEDIIAYFASIARQMQDPRGADGCAAPNPSDRWHSIEWMQMRKGLIILKKRS